MEPSSIEAKKAPRSGSLENPEIVENVPGHVIPILTDRFLIRETIFPTLRSHPETEAV